MRRRTRNRKERTRERLRGRAKEEKNSCQRTMPVTELGGRGRQNHPGL